MVSSSLRDAYVMPFDVGFVYWDGASKVLSYFIYMFVYMIVVVNKIFDKDKKTRKILQFKGWTNID